MGTAAPQNSQTYVARNRVPMFTSHDPNHRREHKGRRHRRKRPMTLAAPPFTSATTDAPSQPEVLSAKARFERLFAESHYSKIWPVASAFSLSFPGPPSSTDPVGGNIGFPTPAQGVHLLAHARSVFSTMPALTISAPVDDAPGPSHALKVEPVEVDLSQPTPTEVPGTMSSVSAEVSTGTSLKRSPSIAPSPELWKDTPAPALQSNAAAQQPSCEPQPGAERIAAKRKHEGCVTGGQHHPPTPDGADGGAPPHRKRKRAQTTTVPCIGTVTGAGDSARVTGT